MDDLVTWLRAQLGDDELGASAADSGHGWRYEAGEYGPRVFTGDDATPWDRDVNPQVWRCDDEDDGCPDQAREWAAEGKHMARYDPARVLREVEAKRRIIELYELLNEPALYEAIQCLALPVADRPGYRDEWRP